MRHAQQVTSCSVQGVICQRDDRAANRCIECTHVTSCSVSGDTRQHRAELQQHSSLMYAFVWPERRRC